MREKLIQFSRACDATVKKRLHEVDDQWSEDAIRELDMSICRSARRSLTSFVDSFGEAPFADDGLELGRRLLATFTEAIVALEISKYNGSKDYLEAVQDKKRVLEGLLSGETLESLVDPDRRQAIGA